MQKNEALMLNSSVTQQVRYQRSLIGRKREAVENSKKDTARNLLSNRLEREDLIKKMNNRRVRQLEMEELEVLERLQSS